MAGGEKEDPERGTEKGFEVHVDARAECRDVRRSTVIQTSQVHTARCDDPEAALERLTERMVRPASSC